MKSGPWRLIFLGSPYFALPSLAALLEAGEEVMAVITQPDRPRGRGQKMSPTPVKEFALTRGLPVLEPQRLKDPEFIARLREMQPELMVVVAYGRLLPPEILALPSVGFLNVHASLLPRHRGAAPIQWALLEGDEETGVTIMWVTYEVDAGPIFLQERLPILPEDNAGSLSARLADLGARLLVKALDLLRRGEGRKIPQPETGVSYAPPLTPDMRLVPWKAPAKRVFGLIRALDPEPGAYTFINGRRLGLFGARLTREHGHLGLPGTVLGLCRGLLEVACGEGSVGLQELQAPGRRRLPAAEFLRGQNLLGKTLG